MKIYRIVCLIIISVFTVNLTHSREKTEALKIASYHGRKASPDQIAKSVSIKPLTEWLRRVSSLNESTERQHYAIDSVYKDEKNPPPQSKPRFSKVTGPCSLFCRVKKDGTLYDFKVLISSGDADFDFCGLLVLKAQRRFPKCPSELPYKRGMIVNVSNRAGQARRSAYIAPFLLNPAKFYTGASKHFTSSSIYSSINQKPYRSYGEAKVPEPVLQKKIDVITKLGKMKHYGASYLILARCKYLEDLIQNDEQKKCIKQLDELADIIQHNSLFSLQYPSISDSATSLLIKIIESENNKYSQTFLSKLENFIDVIESNTDFGFFTKEPEKINSYYSKRYSNWITFERFEKSKNSKLAQKIVDTIYKAKQKRYQARFFNNQYWLSTIVPLAKDKNLPKEVTKYSQNLSKEKSKYTAAYVIGTIENMFEDRDVSGAEIFLRRVLKEDLVKSDSSNWSRTLAELSTLFANKNKLAFADQLIRESCKTSTYVSQENLKVLIDKYKINFEYEKASDLYKYLGKLTGKYYYRMRVARLQLEASTKVKGKKDYWLSKSKTTFQSLLNDLTKKYGNEGSHVSNINIRRTRDLEKFGYQRQADALSQFSKNRAKGTGSLERLHFLEAKKPSTDPEIMNAKINACKWLVQNKQFNKATKLITELATTIALHPWNHKNGYPRMTSDLNYLWGESLGRVELKESLNELIDAVEKNTNRGLSAHTALYRGKRYKILKEKTTKEQLEYLFKVKKKRLETHPGDNYLGPTIEVWLNDLIKLAQHLKRYDDALIFQKRLLALKSVYSSAIYKQKALFEQVRIKVLAGDIASARTEFSKLNFENSKHMYNELYNLASTLSDRGLVDLSAKVLRIGVDKCFRYTESKKAIDKFITGCNKHKQYELLNEFFKYLFQKCKGQTLYRNFFNEWRVELADILLVASVKESANKAKWFNQSVKYFDDYVHDIRSRGKTGDAPYSSNMKERIKLLQKLGYKSEADRLKAQ